MKKAVFAFLAEHKGAVSGILIGLLASILILTIGFWKTLLIAVLVCVCYACGRSIDKGEEPIDSLINWLFRIRNLFKKH